MGEVSYFEYQVPEEGITISLRRQEGSASLFASNKLQNPNAAFYDYRIDGNGEVFVDLEELLGGGDGSSSQEEEEDKRKRREVEVRLIGNTTLYVSVEGIGDTLNVFQIETSFGNTGVLACTSMLICYTITV